ncbi:J domain-containing protein [Glycocaulis abyssi]|uniref:J domain-containing protein n=1 Tax=Glycocaulis abyssi TaxID=1433403 RepID=A0ABV9N8Z4_9PROT
MNILFGVLIALGAMVLLAWLFARAKPSSVVKIGRSVAAVFVILLGVLMTMRGMGILGVPMVLAGIGFLLTGTWRGRPGFGRGGQDGTGRAQSRASQSESMSIAEARATLGVEPGASPEDIQRAYREMMKKVHPDTGGSGALARRVQMARDLLIGD